MSTPDGSMTFDWIFFAILIPPMILAVWELLKNRANSVRGRRG